MIDLLLIFSQLLSGDVIQEQILARYTGEPVYWVAETEPVYPDGQYAEAQVYNLVNGLIVAEGAVEFDGASPLVTFELTILEVGMYGARTRNCLPVENDDDICTEWFDATDGTGNGLVYAVLAPAGGPTLDSLLAEYRKSKE